ncbi:hypothetical protein F4782DRAFT_548734 [Xylaria castorea]|nr:hypothetical protein F4782DRAFT_548734 [Xylaria castorea]
MAWRENPTPGDYRRLHVPDIDWDHGYDYREWRWPNWKFGYKRDALFESLHAEFNCMAFAIQDPFSWFCDVHELINASKSREEFEIALRKRRDERFKEIQVAWGNTIDELVFNIPLWEDPQMDRDNRWNTFIEVSRHFSFDSLLAHFGNYLPKNRAHMPNEKSAAAPQALEQPEQPRQPDQPSVDKQYGPDDEVKAQFRSHVQGLINQLTNDNITGIIEKLTYLYQTNTRQLVTSTLVDLIIAFAGSTEKQVDLFFTMIAGFIAAVDKTMGVAVSAQFVRHLMETLENRSAATSKAQSDAGSKHLDLSLPPPSPPPPPAKKTGKTRVSREKTSKGPVRNGQVEKPPPKRRTTKNNTSNASEGTRRSARLQQRAARGGSG